MLDSDSNRLLIVFALAAPTSPFGLSLSFDKLRMIGNTKTSNTNPTPFGLSLSKPSL
jgi:hypothetical protein